MDGEVEAETRTGRRWWTVKAADFKLTCDKLCDIPCRQVGLPFFIFFFYRFVLAGYFFGFLIYFIVYSAHTAIGVKFLIYLTDWTFILITAYFITAFVNVFTDYILDSTGGNGSSSNRTTHRLRFQLVWLLFYMSITVSLIVTLVYWPILRPMLSSSELPPLYFDLSIHLFPCVFCIIDLFITQVVIRYVHVIYPMVYLLIYGLFALIYWAAGGTDPYGHPYIYPIIDFENYPGVAVGTILGVTVAVFLFHGLVKLLYYLRVRYIDVQVEASTEEERNSLIRDGQSSYDEIA